MEVSISYDDAIVPGEFVRTLDNAEHVKSVLNVKQEDVTHGDLFGRRELFANSWATISLTS